MCISTHTLRVNAHVYVYIVYAYIYIYIYICIRIYICKYTHVPRMNGIRQIWKIREMRGSVTTNSSRLSRLRSMRLIPSFIPKERKKDSTKNSTQTMGNPRNKRDQILLAAVKGPGDYRYNTYCPLI